MTATLCSILFGDGVSLSGFKNFNGDRTQDKERLRRGIEVALRSWYDELDPYDAMHTDLDALTSLLLANTKAVIDSDFFGDLTEPRQDL